MKFKKPIQPLTLLAIALLVPAFPSPSPARQPQTSQEMPSPPLSDEEARGAFIRNRNKTSKAASDTTPSAVQQQPQPAQAGAPKSPPPAGDRRKTPPRRSPTAASAGMAGSPAPVAAPAPVRIGVGFTLYQRNDRGEAVRVSPAKTFRKDDSVRFVIEPNIDGHLYIFYCEGEAEPVMIFPDHRLHDGDNKIIAHIPYEVPSRHSKTPWFVFDEKTAVENLLIVVTRTPLDGIPAGAGLVKYCLPVGEDCLWKPSKPQYDLVTRESDQPKIVSLSKSLGQLQAATEEVAIAKGLKLKSQEPEPTIVQMNVSTALDILVMKTQLIHR